MRNRNMSCVYRIEVSKSMELKQKYQQPKAWKSECILTLNMALCPAWKQTNREQIIKRIMSFFLFYVQVQINAGRSLWWSYLLCLQEHSNIEMFTKDFPEQGYYGFMFTAMFLYSF